MEGEISLEKQTKELPQEGEKRSFGDLEDRVGVLLTRYDNVVKERDDLAKALEVVRYRLVSLEERVESLSQDRERFKVRIDQLLHRLKGVET